MGFGCLLHHILWSFVWSQPCEFRMPESIDLRSILHPFMAWVTKSRAQRLLRDDWAQR
jgi:hypothetical protein